MAENINVTGGFGDENVTAIKVGVEVNTTSSDLKKQVEKKVNNVDAKPIGVDVVANTTSIDNANDKIKIIYRRISELRSLVSNRIKLSVKADDAENELKVLNQFIAETRKEFLKLKKEAGSSLPKGEYSKLNEEYRKLLRERTLLRARVKDSTSARNKSSQSKNADRLKANYFEIGSKYDSRKDDAGIKIKESLSEVGSLIRELEKLNAGTDDYGSKLKEANRAWVVAKRLIGEDDKRINDLTKTLDRYKTKAEKNILGVSQNAPDESGAAVKDANQHVIDLRNQILQQPYADDFFSDEFQKDFLELKDAMLEADAITKAYTESYGKLESKATQTLSNIYKAHSKLSSAGIGSFDNVLVGSSSDSLESQLKSLMKMDSQSEEYKSTLLKILDVWRKISAEIDSALAKEDDAEKQVKTQKREIEKLKKKIESIRKVSRQSGQQYNTELQDYIKKEIGNEGLPSFVDSLEKNVGTPDFLKFLDDAKRKIEDIFKEVDKLKSSYQSSRGANQYKNDLMSLIRQVESYKQSLVGLASHPEIEDTLNEIIESAKEGISSGSVDIKKLRGQFYSIREDAMDARLEAENTFQKLNRLFGEHFLTTLATTGVALVTKGLQEVCQNVVKIDSAMTELKKVTNETSSGYERFTKRAASAARELGADLSSYVNAVADWARLGYSLVDAEELARVSTLFRNVGDGISAIEDASSYMVSILNGFHIAAEDAQSVVDIINEVANNEPISASGIAEILTRSSAAMYAAGNTLEETIALGTAMNSVLQNEETTGTTMKTVSMYLRAAKTEAEDAGIEIDGMAESTSKLRKEMKSLTGVDIMANAEGTEFKSTYQILKEISEVWDNLSDVTQANVTNLLGGKRNANAVTSVLENFSIAENSLKDAANSANSAIKENREYLDSVQGKLDQLSSSFQKFSQDFLDSDLIKWVVDLGTAVVDLADGAVNLAGVLPTIAAAASTILSIIQMNGKLKDGAGKVNMPSYIRCI